MARPINAKLIKRVCDAAMSLMTDQGYEQTSVAEIAEKAGVSAGYMYRHFRSKDELAQTIYDRKMKAFLGQILSSIRSCESVEEVISEVVDLTYEIATNEKEVFKFLFMMMHEHTFLQPEDHIIGTRIICKRIFHLGMKTGEISLEADAESIFFVIFSMPFKFFEGRLKKIFSEKKIGPTDLAKLKRMCLKALRA